MRGRSIGEDSLAVFDEETVVVGGRSEEHVLLVVLFRPRAKPADKGSK